MSSEKDERLTCGFLVKNAKLESNHLKTLNKPKLRNSLKYWPMVFKNVRIMKDQKKKKESEELKHLQEPKETWQLTGPEENPGLGKAKKMSRGQFEN